MSAWAVRVAIVATRGAAILVLLLYAPALDAPFLVPKFAALGVTAALGLIAFGLRRAAAAAGEETLRWSPDVALGAALLLGTTGLSWLVAARTGGAFAVPYAGVAIARWISLLGLACGASVLSDDAEACQALLAAVTVAAASVAIIGLLQHLEILPFFIPVISKPGSTFGNRNLAAEAIAMASPMGVAAALGARRREAKAVIVAAVAVELVYLGVTRTRGAWVGAICGLAAVLWFTRVRWSARRLALAAGLAAAVALAATFPGRFNPHDAGDTKRYSDVVQVLEGGVDVHSTAVRTRIGLWRRTLEMIADHPWLGVGPGNWPVFFPVYAEPGATADGVLSVAVEPRQAHDDVLERTAETGVIGLAALLFFAVGVARSARRHLAVTERRHPVAGAAGALVTLVALSLPAFPLEMPGTLALAGLAVGLVARADSRSPGPAWTRSFASAIGYGALAAGTAFALLVGLRSSAEAYESWWLAASERARAQHRGPVGDAEALPALQKALRARPGDRRALLAYGKLVLRQGDPVRARDAADRILRLEPEAPNAWALRSAAELALDELEAAHRDADHAIALLDDNPLALMTRAEAEAREGDLDSAARDRAHLKTLAAGAPADGTARAARVLLNSR